MEGEVKEEIKEEIREETKEIKQEPQKQPEQPKIEEITETKPKRKLFANIKFKPDKKFWIILALIILLIAIIYLGVWIRTQNIPQLKDVTTGQYTLGPDLDPFLFLRHAKEISENRLENPDMMRAAPLGVQNYAKTSLMPWAIVFIYKILNIFWEPPTATVEFAAIIAPVIFFALTLIVFFFFIKKLFSFITNKRNALTIALIATVFYAVIPPMLHRTTAGIPEIESLGMLWFWCAFLFFTWAWQSKKIKKIMPLAILSGIFTGLMIFTWGGNKYIFMTFALASFLVFFFNKQKKKNFLIFTSWLIPTLIFAFAENPTFEALTVISDTGFASIIFSLLLVDMIVFNTKLKKIREKIKLPESVITMIILIVIGFIGLLIINPNLISQTASKVVEGLLYPFGRGRVSLTVAENKAPYFVEVFGSFSYLFWLFFFGTLLLFYEATKHFDNKNKILLNSFFIIFMITFIFSRISPQSLLNGENFISKFLYFGGLIIFAFVLLYIYISAYVRKEYKISENFKNINFSYILALAFIFWMIVSMRGAIRLFFIISPALIIASAFLPIKLAEYSFKTKDKLYKILLWCGVILVVVCLIITFINYTKSTAQSAKYTIPGPYYQQWQKAMEWVREETPKNSIFAHWWDYGYWVQTLGERPTVLDGGHAYHGGFWNYLMGRHVLCGQNENEALEFLYAHNASYLLIDSTEIGKYSAYGGIGSDESGYDRLSWINAFVLDPTQTQETGNETAYVYVGGTMFDQDVEWEGQIFPRGKAIIVGFLLVIDKETGEINEIKNIVYYNEKQYRIPIKYVYINGELKELEKKDEKLMNGALYLIPSVGQQINSMGAALYLSEKALNAQWVKLYLFDESENFELVHSQDNLFVEQLKQNNITISDIIYAGGILGPIKIWKINYPENFTIPDKKLKRYLQPKSDLPFDLW
ncbi:MAG: hypothetical protein IB618_02695 [Candidatus Pacearchaeota archaeon]|nr:MAG: hypothetical protein IB618_02695 [Candidatus Pacearchaeota archaeon]